MTGTEISGGNNKDDESMFEKMNLNGIWDFSFTSEPLEKIISSAVLFQQVIQVPGCFDALPEYDGKRGCGVYRRFVECGDGLVRLKIGALGLRGKIFWDGELLAVSELPYTPEEFVFRASGGKTHELMIAVENILHDEDSCMFHAFYDFYGYGGIYREVSLEELPEFYIERVQVTPLSHLEGSVKLQVFTAGTMPEKFDWSFAFDGGAEVKSSSASAVCELTCRVPDFQVWSPDSPKLHRVRVTLGNHSATAEFGIRTLSWSGRQFKVNGVAVPLIGYNRHESHPEFGAATPPWLMLSDLNLIKGQGCNFVRGCHYAQSEEFLSLCDRMGMFVWDESLGWGNSEAQLNDPVFQSRQVEQTVKMVRNSVNHPSVVMWGFLNEAATNQQSARTIVSALRSAVLQEDASRPITFGSNRGDKDVCLEFADIVSFNTYPGWYGGMEKENALEDVVPELERLAAFSLERYPDKPLIVSEIGAAAICGDHSGRRWSEEYQSELLCITLTHILDHPAKFNGLTMWQFCNAKTYVSTSGFLTRPRGFNNKGVVDEFRRPKLAWKTIRDVLSLKFKRK